MLSILGAMKIVLGVDWRRMVKVIMTMMKVVDAMAVVAVMVEGDCYYY